VVKMAQDLITRRPSVGESAGAGTNVVSFGPAVREATGQPFSDTVTLTR
jgi:hypothetical protein